MSTIGNIFSNKIKTNVTLNNIEKNFLNFIWDCFIKSFENKDALIVSTSNFSDDDKILIIKNVYHDLNLWEKIYNERLSFIYQHVKIKVANNSFELDNVDFHEKYGWVLTAKGYKAFLGKSSLIDSIQLEIGHRTYISGNNIIRGNGELIIGSFCSIASDFYISVSNENHPIQYPASIGLGSELRMLTDNFLSDFNLNHQNEKKIGITLIGNDVWIGRNVSIFAGVKIGHGAVVGAHSLVTKDLESYGIYAGYPAKLIRYRFDASKIVELLRLEWWNWDVEKIRNNKKFFSTDLSNYKESISNLIEKE